MKNKELTKREKDIFEFICKYYILHGYSPSIREIQKGVYLQSPTMIHRYLIQLMDKNYISITPKIARGITIKSHF